MRICDILTVRSPGVRASLERQRKAWQRAGVVIEVRCIAEGPYSMQSACEEVIAAPAILKEVLRAERDGFDAIVLDCMVDPALRAAREAVRIPVMGPCQSGLAVASTLGRRVAVVGLANTWPLLNELIYGYGFGTLVVAQTVVDIALPDLINEFDRSLEAIASVIDTVVRDSRADTVLLGCTVMSEYVPQLRQRFDLPVLEPMRCAIEMATLAATMGVTHSKRGYPSPPHRPPGEGVISLYDWGA